MDFYIEPSIFRAKEGSNKDDIGYKYVKIVPWVSGLFEGQIYIAK